jgi:predicted ATP-dependent endonuclease of OLD family
LNFIKKHIKFKASELFFADAVIFVEGITEEVLLKYYLSIDEQLNKKYTTIFNINGAHGLVYHHLIKLLAVPTLVITDLDIKRSELEKESYLQISSLSGRSTTNNTIRKYNTIKLKLESLNLSWESVPQTFSLLDFSMYRYIQNNSISLLSVNHFIDNNLYVAFQGDKIEDIFATSLEESLILTNYDNEVLNNALYGTIRNKYLKIIGKEKDKLNLVHNSYRLQKELSDSKSDFANELLYQLSINEDKTKLPKLPNYIEDALEWLKTEFGFTQDEE